MISWFVAHTHPMKEDVAQKHLLEQGFDVYLPRFKKIRRHARKVDEVLAPLFPRYLFVGMDLDTALWRSINGTRGISYLLTGTNDRPLGVPSSLILSIQEQENADGIVPVSSLAMFENGAKVRILDGAFEGHVGVYEKMTDQDRVRVLLSFMGRETKVLLPVYAVEAA